MRVLFIVTICLIPYFTTGQARTIAGKVLDENDLIPFPGIKIQNRDTVLLGTTDSKGNFKVELAPGTDELLLSFIGMEWTSIKIPASCDNAEVIMMHYGIYDFMTVGAENRKRYKRFKDLKNQHRQAFEKGIFTSPEPCVTYVFSKH